MSARKPSLEWIEYESIRISVPEPDLIHHQNTYRLSDFPGIFLVKVSTVVAIGKVVGRKKAKIRS
jgi:hypothetical protein